MSEEAEQLREKLRYTIWCTLHSEELTDDLLTELLDAMKYSRGDVVLEVITGE